MGLTPKGFNVPPATPRVSVTELQTHPELDTDGDGVLSEEEAQVRAPLLGHLQLGSLGTWRAHVFLLPLLPPRVYPRPHFP